MPTLLIFILGNFKNTYTCCYEKIRAILIILSLLSQLIYECIAIWRLVLSCKINDKEIIKDDWILHGLKVIRSDNQYIQTEILKYIYLIFYLI